MKRTYFSLLIVFVFLMMNNSSFLAQEKKFIDAPLEKIEDIPLWDEKLQEKINSLCSSTIPYKNLNPEEFEQMISFEDVQLVDVRTEKEYTEGHIPGAILLDVKQADFIDLAIKHLDSQKYIAVYCKGGVRGRKAADQLLLNGFKVYNLDRGFDQWKKAGKPIEHLQKDCD